MDLLRAQSVGNCNKFVPALLILWKKKLFQNFRNLYMLNWKKKYFPNTLLFQPSLIEKRSYFQISEIYIN